MAKMSQPGTDRGTQGETGERIPRGANSRDFSGEKKVKVPYEDSRKGEAKSETGIKTPAKVTASDRSGEKKVGIVGGVAMGAADNLKGRDPSHMGHFEGHKGEFNDGKHDGKIYEHAKEHYIGNDHDGKH